MYVYAHTYVCIYVAVYIYIYIYIYVCVCVSVFHTYVFICKNKLAILVEGDLKDKFSITTTLRCREGCNSIPRIAPLYP